jgi:hypothetical protein
MERNIAFLKYLIQRHVGSRDLHAHECSLKVKKKETLTAGMTPEVPRGGSHPIEQYGPQVHQLAKSKEEKKRKRQRQRQQGKKNVVTTKGKQSKM